VKRGDAILYDKPRAFRMTKKERVTGVERAREVFFWPTGTE